MQQDTGLAPLSATDEASSLLADVAKALGVRGLGAILPGMVHPAGPFSPQAGRPPSEPSTRWLRRARQRPQRTAFFTSAVILASSVAVNLLSAY